MAATQCETCDMFFWALCSEKQMADSRNSRDVVTPRQEVEWRAIQQNERLERAKAWWLKLRAASKAIAAQARGSSGLSRHKAGAPTAAPRVGHWR